MNIPEIFEHLWKNTPDLVKVLTAVGIIGYAVWRLVAGYYIVNLSVNLRLERTPSTTGGKHDLVTIVNLKKGNRATLSLDSITVGVILYPTEVITRKTIRSAALPELQRPLNLTPGEETQFASHLEVPDDTVCEVEITVNGRRYRPTLAKILRIPARPSCWKASAISVPYLKEQIISASNSEAERQVIEGDRNGTSESQSGAENSETRETDAAVEGTS